MRKTRTKTISTTKVTAKREIDAKSFFQDGAKSIQEGFWTPLRKSVANVRPRVALFSVLVILVATIVPTAMAFGTGEGTLPAGTNIGNLIEITDAYFYPGSPGDENKIPIGGGTNYEDGVPIQEGDYALYFSWRLIDLHGAVANGDWFDVTIDLGLTDIPAKVAEQKGAFAPIIYLENSQTAGSIRWVNSTKYSEQQYITLRLALDDPKFEGLVGDGSDEKQVKGTGLWGFRYQAGKDTGGSTAVTWKITVGDSQMPGGSTVVVPQPPHAPPEGSNETKNPYDKKEPGYDKTGYRLTADTTPAADTIFYWNIFINGHKHASLDEWAACPNNSDKNTLNDDPPPPPGDTFTIVDAGTGIRPTWLRNVTNADGKPAIDPSTPILIDKATGRYGNGLEDKSAPAYLKLFYVNSEAIWQDRIDKEGSGYETPANDPHESHEPPEGHSVGAYDPNFSTSYLNEGEESALLYAPNYSGSGEKYYNYLTPVPSSDIKSILLTDTGFEIEMYTSALFGDGTRGRTLAIGFMTKAATDAQGAYGQNVSNTVAIKGVNEGAPVVSESARVLLGGTVSGGYLTSPNKGKFILEKLDRNTAQPMEGVVFEVTASSADAVLAQAAQMLIDGVKAASLSGLLKTGANGKIELPLPDPPWSAGLTLTIEETVPDGYVGVKPFTVTIEPENRSVILIETQAGDKKLVESAADRYGVLVWNKSALNDRSYYDVALRKWVKKVERAGADGLPMQVYLNMEPNTDTPGVMNGDRVLFRIDVYNQSRNYTQVTKITDYLPAGLKFDPAATVQNPDKPDTPYTNAVWQLKAGSDNVLEYIGPPLNFLGWGWSGTEGVYPDDRLPLILTVDIPEDATEGGLLTNIAEVTEILDEAGNPVEDIDSTPDGDQDNDGQVPGIDYGETPPPGTVKDNEIEEHRLNEDGETDRAADEDDHDYAQVRLPKLIACEVDKDTIRRTSAAYESLPGEEGWNNIGVELFRYDVNARSTSLLPADAFVIDDPLQNVAADQIRLVSLWTPVSWGDIDGKFNVWYQTNKTDPGVVYDDARATTVDYKTNDLPEDMKWLPNTGYKLWAKDLDPRVRTRLDIAALGLAADEYVTALRFEYGAVLPGFTTKNDATVSLNGERRDASGRLDEELRQIAVLAQPAPVATETVPETPAPAEKQSFGDKLLTALGLGGNKTETDVAPDAATVGSPDGMAALSLAELDVLAAASAAQQDIVDWTPKNGDPFYDSGQIEEVSGSELYPISYLVQAARPMQVEDITATAVSRIAKKSADTGSWMQDADEDGVITKELVSFSLAESGDVGPVRVSSTYVDSIPRFAETAPPAGEGGTGAVRTYDEMKPWLWAGLLIAAIACLILLLYRRGLFRRILPAGDVLPALAAAVRGLPVFRPKSGRGRHRRRHAR